MKKSRSQKRKLVETIFLTLVSFVAIAGLSLTYLFVRGEPDYSENNTILNLSAPVRIYHDDYGIPHIFASNMNDAARALGYVHASERLFQMEMQRRAGQGRLAEILGPEMLGVDKFIRTLGLYRLSESSFAALSPQAQSYFNAYAEGVNSFLETHKNKLPVEFLLLHFKPEPWQAADSVVWGKLMALQLSHNYHLEILRAELLQKLPAEKVKWLFSTPFDMPITTQPTTMNSAEDESQKLGSFLGLDHAASNEWVIGGARTTTGKPILANDPHLSLEAPILWYLARIVTPEVSLKGATVPGLPIVLLGQNDKMAWGFTTTGSDTEDLFVETLDPKATDHYLTPSGSEAFLTRTEIIHVKGGQDVILKVRATRHGPVLSDNDKNLEKMAGPGKVIALAFTGLGAKDTTSEALMLINRAENAASFLEALRLYQTPTQNIVYADQAGHFGFISPGLVPLRKSGKGLVPADGQSGAYDWTGMVPFERLPQIANPKAGYVFNANNAVVGENARDYFGEDWEEPYRARRLQEFFSSNEKFDLQQSVFMQKDHLSLVAKEFLPLLLSLTPQNARAQKALDLLSSWDGIMDKRKAAPLIFDMWLLRLHDHMLRDKTGVSVDEMGPFAARAMHHLLTHHAAEWCGEDRCASLIKESFEEALDLIEKRHGSDMDKWRWGGENIALLKNKFYSHIPLLSEISDLSVASSGDFYTLDRGGGFDHDKAHPLARTHGGGYRGDYDLSNPDASLFMIATGESGHIFSPHYGDLVHLWNDVKAVKISGSEKEFQERGAPQMVLSP